jgi:MFS family permease
MGLYAFCLAGSNYFAPVICGFIAQYQGWRWVFYYPSIMLAGCILFLFFFMEETNYVRETIGVVEDLIMGTSTPEERMTPDTADADGLRTKRRNNNENSTADAPERLDAEFKKKTYLQKLSLLGPKKEKNHMFRRVWLSLYFLGWPVIFYAGYVLHIKASPPRFLGTRNRFQPSSLHELRFSQLACSFSYGSYLIWFNVINATASIILGSAPYNFRQGIYRTGIFKKRLSINADNQLTAS